MSAPESRITRRMTEPFVELCPPGAARRAEDDLRGAQPAGRFDERLADVVADDLPVRPAEAFHERPLARERIAGGRREAVLGRDVHGDEVSLYALCHARGTTDEPVAVGGAGERDEHALAGLPGPVDAVKAPVLVECLVDAVGHPEEGELPERTEVPYAEVVAERGIDPLRGIDVPVGHAPAQRFGRHVDELDLVGAAGDLVRDRLPLGDPGDALDDVVERLEVLDVERRDDRDARVEQLVDVLPALLVPRAGDVRVRELVDEDDLRPAPQDRVDVHLLERRAAVFDALPRDHLEVADLRARQLAAVGLDEADDDIGPAAAAPAALAEHRVRLADARRRAEVDAERAAGHGPSGPDSALGVECEVELEDVHARLAHEAERPVAGVLVDELQHARDRQATGLGDARRLQPRVLGRDVRVEAGGGRRHRVDRDGGVGPRARSASGRRRPAPRPCR